VVAAQAPLAQVIPHAPQLAGSAPRSLQTVAFEPVPQQTEDELAPLVQCLWRQVGSTQSVSPLPLLSMPS
jgi:antitoxin (DNA-binding transcriptional repressor) of toxin-antitoxin stability system